MKDQRKHPVPGEYKIKRKLKRNPKRKSWEDSLSEGITQATKFSGFTVFIPKEARNKEGFASEVVKLIEKEPNDTTLGESIRKLYNKLMQHGTK